MPTTTTPPTTTSYHTTTVTNPPTIETSNPTNNINSPEKDLTLFIADENNSPVAEDYRAEAIDQATEFSQTPELATAETQNGLTQTESLSLYKDLLTWFASKNAISLAQADASFDPSLKTDITKIVKDNTWLDPADIDPYVNTLMHLLRNMDDTYHITSKGNLEANILVVIAAFDRIKLTRYKS
jgi:hypothetical protein